MSRVTNELRVIPNAAWIVAGLFYVCVATPLLILVAPTDRNIGPWPFWGQALVVYGGFLLVAALIALIGYVYGDAKRRQMRYVMWTLLAICIPHAIGIILYFILRDPLPTLRPACPTCQAPAEPAWAHCAHCGQQLAGGSGAGAR